MKQFCTSVTINAALAVGRIFAIALTSHVVYWQASQSGLSIEQNFGASGSCTV